MLITKVWTACKGIVFGLLLYPIGVLIAVFSVHVLLKVSNTAVIFFTLEGLLEFVVYGAVLGLTYTA